MYAHVTDWRNGPLAASSTPKRPAYVGLPCGTAVFRRLCAQPVYAATFALGFVEWITRFALAIIPHAIHWCLPQGTRRETFYEKVLDPLKTGYTMSCIACWLSAFAFFKNPWSKVV